VGVPTPTKTMPPRCRIRGGGLLKRVRTQPPPTRRAEERGGASQKTTRRSTTESKDTNEQTHTTPRALDTMHRNRIIHIVRVRRAGAGVRRRPIQTKRSSRHKDKAPVSKISPPHQLPERVVGGGLFLRSPPSEGGLTGYFSSFLLASCVRVWCVRVCRLPPVVPRSLLAAKPLSSVAFGARKRGGGIVVEGNVPAPFPFPPSLAIKKKRGANRWGCQGGKPPADRGMYVDRKGACGGSLALSRALSARSANRRRYGSNRPTRDAERERRRRSPFLPGGSHNSRTPIM
jgi:hypothetical protein